MSHFAVLVDTSKRDLGDLLREYDENKEVPEYEKPCYCIEHGTVSEARKETERLFGGSFEEIKRAPYNALAKELQPDWQEYTRDWIEKERELRIVYSESAKPDPNCNDCNGSGLVKSTYNPQSKWDWYEIGGRYLGYFPLKSDRIGRLGRPGVFNNTPDALTADVVIKKNISMERATSIQLENIEAAWEDRNKPFSDVPRGITKEEYILERQKRHPLQPFAFVDIDGDWHERARMGWWAMTSDDKEPEVWTEEFRTWFDSLPEDAEITAVDCHI